MGGSSTWQREQAVQSSMASTARMVPKPTSHSSITGSRSCSHSNVVGGWSLLHKLGAEMVLADDVAVRLRLLRNTLMHGAYVPFRRHAKDKLWHPGSRDMPRARFSRIAKSERFVRVLYVLLVELPRGTLNTICVVHT